MDVLAALQQLNKLLPLANRHQALPAGFAQLHQFILRRWFDSGAPPDKASLALHWPKPNLADALAQLHSPSLTQFS